MARNNSIAGHQLLRAQYPRQEKLSEASNCQAVDVKVAHRVEVETGKGNPQVFVVEETIFICQSWSNKRVDGVR